MPPLAADLAISLDGALKLARLGEQIRAGAKKGTPAMGLHPRRLEALYEMAFLRMFVAWEVFLEDSLTRYLCGYTSIVSAHALLQPAFATLATAEAALLGGKDYVSWAPKKTVARARVFMSSSAHELVIQSNLSRLEWFVTIRNRVAHKSKFSSTEFDSATLNLAGRRYPAASPGRFLRDWVPGAVPPERWLSSVDTQNRPLMDA